MNDGGVCTRWRLEPKDGFELDQVIEVQNWVSGIVETQEPDVVAIECAGEFGPTQTKMAGLITSVEAEVRKRNVTLLRVPPADLKYFMIPKVSKVSKTDRVKAAMTYPEFAKSKGATRPAHDEADAFFLSIAAKMIAEWLKRGHREIEYPMHQRYILFSHKEAKHGLRGLAHNPGRYLYLSSKHELPKGSVTNF